MSFLKAPPAAPRIPADQVDRKYKTWRFNVFMGIFLGYAAFYLIRNNVSLVSAILKEHDIMNAVGIGIVSNAVLFAYGLSKFFMAMLSDRSNARYFMPLGLALSAVMNLFIASMPAVTGSITLFATLMFINGWFQGMGWPPSGRVLVHWFSTSERGWKTSIWNCAHNVGGGGLGVLSAWALSTFATSEADWRPAFYVPAIVALVIAVIAFLLIRDRPEAMGLPPIEEYRDDPAKVDSVDPAEGSWLQVVTRHVLTNPIIVMLALANVFIYTLRYGVLNWIPIYLAERTESADISDGIIGFAIYELAGILGTLLVGWLSDVVFHGWRSGAGILALAVVGVSLFAYWQLPPHRPAVAVLPAHRPHRRVHLRAGHAHRPAGHRPVPRQRRRHRRRVHRAVWLPPGRHARLVGRGHPHPPLRLECHLHVPARRRRCRHHPHDHRREARTRAYEVRDKLQKRHGNSRGVFLIFHV